MAILVAADLTAGSVPPETLKTLTTSAGASAISEDVVADCALKAWTEAVAEAGFEYFAAPDPFPEGGLRTALVDITIYRLYKRRPETDPQVDIPGSSNVVKASYQAALRRLRENGQVMFRGIAPVPATDDTSDSGGDYFADAQVFTDETRRGFS